MQDISRAGPDRAPAIAALPPSAQRPKVTVVTACYNVLEPLKETIASVAAQGAGGIEHVVIDGGSGDGTAQYLATLGDGIRWISESDGGIADAMNKGVALATGDWIIVLHAGDSFAEAGSLRAVESHLDSDADIVTCGIEFGSGGQYRPLVIDDPVRRLAFKPIPHQGTFCRRTVFETVGGFDGSYRICMDYEFFLRARNAAFRFQASPLMLSRMDDTGVSSQTDWPSLRRRFAEERRAQLAHCPGPAMRLVYAAYWPAYLGFRRVRAALRDG